MKRLVGIVTVLILAASLNGFVGAAEDARPAPLSGYIPDPILESTRDPDGDGLIDSLVLNFTVQANVSGMWRVFGGLDANGTWVGNQTELDLAVGSTAASITFPGWRIRLGQANGPYAVDLSLFHFDSGFFASRVYATAAYAWTAFELRVEFSGSFQSQGIDADGDSLYNYLEIRGSLNVGEPSQYEISAELRDSSGSTYITSTANVTAYPMGISPYRARFNGDAIRSRGIDGPYQIVVELRPVGLLDTYQRRTYPSAPFTASQFLHGPIAFRAGFADSAIDLDGNGKPDVLRVLVPVDVALAGKYHVSGYIPLQFSGAAWGQGSGTLPTGPGTLTLDIDAFPILGNSTDGPYTVDIRVYEDVSPFSIQTSHVTAFYPWYGWDNPYGNLVTPIEVNEKDPDLDGEIDEVEVRATIAAKRAASFFLGFYLSIGFDTLQQFEDVPGGPGTINVSTTFVGWEIQTYRWNGTYAFSVGLWSGGSYLDGNTTDRTYTWDQFEPALRLRGPITFAPLDTDFDGRFNQLVATVPLRVEVEGAYEFALYASDPVTFAWTNDHRSRYLSVGDLDLTMGLSGFDLAGFQGDASVIFSATRSMPGVYREVLRWTGTYPIPDPAVFQSPSMVTITVNLVAPAPLICCSAVSLASYSNAYFPLLSGGAYTVVATVPDADYVAQAYATSTTGEGYLAVLDLRRPLPATISVTVSAAPIEDVTWITFGDWASGTAWTNRTFGNPGGRFPADRNMNPDGTVDVEEIANAFHIWGGAGLPAIDVRVDDLALVSVAGQDEYSGAGPVVGSAPLALARPWQLNLPQSANTTRRIAVSVSREVLAFDRETTIRVPAGWTVSVDNAPPAIEVTQVDAGAVRLRPTTSQPEPWTVNLTANATGAAGAIRGRVVDQAGSPIPRATVTLLRTGTEVAKGTTGADGRFSLAGLEEGTYEVRVRADGYVEVTRTVTLGPAELVDLGDVALAPPPPSSSLPLLAAIATAILAGIAATALLLWRRARRGKQANEQPPRGPETS